MNIALDLHLALRVQGPEPGHGLLRHGSSPRLAEYVGQYGCRLRNRAP